MTSPLSIRIREALAREQIAPAALVLALLGAFLTWFFFTGARLEPLASYGNETATLAFLGFFGPIKFLFALAPLVALRRPWTALCLSLPVIVWILLAGANLPMALYVGLLAIAMVSVFSGNRLPIAVAFVGALAVVGVYTANLRDMAVPFGAIVSQKYDVGDPQNSVIIFAVYTLVSGCLLGLAFLLRARSATREERMALAESGRVLARDSAVVEERARLARDLHDVVAHHVSLIAVRAEAAPFQHPDMDATAKGVLAEIGADARLALDELRDVLGVLRRGEDDPGTEPQPGAGDISLLVDQARDSGQVVEVTGELPAMKQSRGYVAYRVIQEALTNARRHAPGKTVSIHLGTGESGDVEMSVSNRLIDGRGGSVEGGGLAGMRERIEALGGELEAGQRGGDFVVHARIPRESTTQSTP